MLDTNFKLLDLAIANNHRYSIGRILCKSIPVLDYFRCVRVLV